VRGFVPRLDDVLGLEQFTPALEAAGVRDAFALLARWDDEDVRAALRGLDDATRDRALDDVRILTLRGMGARGRDWLAAADVRTVEELATTTEEDLHQRWHENTSLAPPHPTPAEVRVWIRAARTVAAD